MADRDIPEEIVEKATRRLYEVERIVRPFERLSPERQTERQTELRSNARSVLSAALAGRQVVELPAPNGTDEGGTWWNHDHGAVIADDLCTAATAQYMRRRAGALLAAAHHIEQRLRAAGSGSGED